MYHKWYDDGWGGSQTFWEGFGGTFRSLLPVVSWGMNRLDIFGIGTDNAMYHKYWSDAGWQPARFEPLGGSFNSTPAAVCWGADRIDVFCLGADNSMFHKALTATGVGATGATGANWEALGGIFDPA
jgi:hypothetical protein